MFSRCQPCNFFDNLLNRDNLALLVTRQLSIGDFRHVFISRKIIDRDPLSLATRERTQAFPIYLYPDTKNATLFDTQEPTDAPGGRRPNLAPDFIVACEAAWGLAFIPDGRGDLVATFGPEDVFHYAYAVFHSPTYRSRYAEFLKIDFPRLPLTSDLALFRQLVQRGADLVALHLLEDDYPAASWNRPAARSGRSPTVPGSPLCQPSTTFVAGDNGTTMGAFSKRSCYQDGRVYLDTGNRQRSSYFDGVPEDVWQFEIGGYQVLRKWLYDRRGKRGEPGRTLMAEDIVHYQRIVVALRETMRLMGEIDAVIDDHGGWPVG